MRRFGAVILSLVLACGLFVMPARAENDGAGDEPMTGMANPWTETEDLAEAIEGSGIEFDPPVEESLPVPEFEMNFWKYLYMDGTIEARYENVDNEMIIRASTELAGTDLSGAYNEYTEEWEENFKGLAVTCRGDGETVNCATFGSGEVNFSVTFNAGEEGRGITVDELQSLVMGMQAVPLSEAERDTEEAEEETDGESAELPEPGDVIEGFETLELRDFPEFGATAVWFEHEKTGAKLMYVANDDPDRSFALGFRTDAIDNTGLPHVFEHSCLSGSEKYPSDALWFSTSYQTYNTFMNAFTMDRLTMYPVASLSEAQLLKLADFYTDSCLHPNILENEEIYRTEAWRYRMADPEDDLTIEGTVYSEMLGATTIDTAAYLNAVRLALPGSMLGNESGGDPDYIPDMTWEALKEYHSLYYHPSNSIAVLYGDFEHYEDFLALLDGYYDAYEKQEFTREDAEYEPITEPVSSYEAFPVESGSPADHASRVYYSFVLKDVGDMDAVDSFAQILSLPASPLQIRLKEELPFGSFTCMLEPAGPEPLLMFEADDIDPDDAEVFASVVDEVLEDIAENGFDEELMEGVNSTIVVNNKLLRENTNIGVDIVSTGFAYNYSVTGDPWSYLDTIEYMNDLKERNSEGVYAAVASDYLVGSETCALSVTYPEPGAKEEKDAALAEHLAEVKAEMSEEEIDAIVEASNSEKKEEDISEMIASLQAVTVDSLPEEVKLYDVLDETDESGIRHLDVPAGVDGIGSVSIMLDVAGLPQEYIHYMTLYSSLLGELDTSEHTKAELATLMNRFLYGQGFGLSLPYDAEDETKVIPYFRMSWISLDENLEAGYDLVRELVYDTRTDDAQKVLDQVQALKSSLKNQINAAPYAVNLYRAIGRTSDLYAYYNYANYLEYYEFLTWMENELTENPENALLGFDVVKDYLNNRTGAVTMCAGNEESIELNRGLAGEFLASLDEKEIEPAEYDFAAAASSEGLVVDTGVQFNLLYADYETLGLEEFEGSFDAVTALVSDLYLIPLLRDQYGVYSVWNAALERTGMYLISYRDPNVKETFEVFASLADLIAEAEVDEETLNGYILSSYSAYAMPSGELSGALNAAMCALQGESQEKPLEYMRQLKEITPESIADFAEVYRKLSEDGVLATAGPASAIEANADLYEVVLNPFGVVDTTAIELSDVAEDHPQYEAVRFVFDNGLMAVKEGTEDEFGVDDPATVADIMGAMYAYIGGARDPEEALGLFASYGIASPEMVLEDELTGETAVQLLGSLAGAFGVDWTAEADDTVLTRGDLAELFLRFDSETE